MSTLTSRKSELTSEELSILQIELEKQGKNMTLAYVLWFFLGGIGIHRFYVGDTKTGILMLCLNWLTCGLWALIDAFFLHKKVHEVNEVVENDLINQILANRRSRQVYQADEEHYED